MGLGSGKNGGYNKMATLPPNIIQLLNNLGSQSQGYTQQAAQGYSQFLPGGGGGQAITDAANKNYRQNTIPSILNAFGSNSKGGSALNQALAASAADLNSSLGSKLAQMQLNAANGLGSLGLQQQNLATQTPQWQYNQAQSPLTGILQALISAGGTIGGAYLGGPAGAAGGSAAASAVNGLLSGYSKNKNYPGVQFNADRD